MTRRTRLLGVVVGDLADETLARFVVGVEQEAERRGYALAIVSLNSSQRSAGADAQPDCAPAPLAAEVHERSLLALLERRVDGVLLAAPQLEEDERLTHLLRGRVPVVSLHALPGGGATLVGSDHERVGRLATEHLMEHGHRRIGVVAGPRSRRVVRARLRGQAAALRAVGLDLAETLVAEGDWTPAGGSAAARRLLSRVPDLAAVVVHNDLMAVGVLHGLHQLQRTPPEGVALVSVDDIPIAAHTVPPLTTVRIPFAETGEVAAGILVDRVEHRPAPERHVISTSLVRRASCGCPPATSTPPHPEREEKLDA